jgi:hypothetical protein
MCSSCSASQSPPKCHHLLIGFSKAYLLLLPSSSCVAWSTKHSRSITEGRKDPFHPFGPARNVSISELYMTLERRDTKVWPHFFSCGCITMGPKENLCQQVRASLCAIYFWTFKTPRWKHGSNEREGKKHLEYQTYTKCINQGGWCPIIIDFTFCTLVLVGRNSQQSFFLSLQFDLVYVGQDVKSATCLYWPCLSRQGYWVLIHYRVY